METVSVRSQLNEALQKIMHGLNIANEEGVYTLQESHELMETLLKMTEQIGKLLELIPPECR